MDATGEQLLRLLHGFLDGHGVEARIEGDKVVLPRTQAAMTLELVDTYPSGSVLLGCRAWRGGHPVLQDLWAGLGEHRSAALNDGVQAFTIQDFHVLLASHAGVLEDEQVEWYAFEKDGATYDLYVGPMNGRASPGTALELVPQWDALVAAIEETTVGSAHAIRLFASALGGKLTNLEALRDGETHPALARLLAQSVKGVTGTGYASQRLFACVLRRSGEAPAHHLRRAGCGGG